jgi:hypothetical protein
VKTNVARRSSDRQPNMLRHASSVLQHSQNQLPVLQAVGGAAKMAAQYTADFKDAMDGGSTATEATAVAASHLEAAQSQIDASAQSTLWNLQNQYQVSAAITGEQKIQAQQQATYNQLVHEGASTQVASQVASQQAINASAAASAQVYKQAYELRKNSLSIEQEVAAALSHESIDQAKMAVAVNAQAAGAQAYADAMALGANSAAATAISTATTASYIDKATVALNRQVAALQAADDASANALTAAVKWQGEHLSNGKEAWPAGAQYTSEGGNPNFNSMLREQARQESLGIGGLVDNAFQGGNITTALNTAKNAPNSYGADPSLAAAMAKHGYDLTAILGPQRSNIDDKMTAVDNLTQLQNAQTTDKGTQVSNLQSEMAWLNTLPETISRDQKIVSLQQSIDSLKNATDANTAAVNATLNPLYSQGHSALPQIGYFHAASGLDMVAQGPSSGDQVPFHAMVNGGERIQIGPASKGGASQGGNSAPSITQYFDMRGVSTNNARRSQRQFAQGFGQMAAAASR